MKIRLAKSTDLPNIVSLWWEMQKFHFKYDEFFYHTKPEQNAKEMSTEYFKYSIKEKNHILIVIEKDKKLIGMLHCEISTRPPVLKEEKEAQIVETVVTAQYRGQRLFQQMFDYLKKELKLRNIRFCILSVDKDNTRAIKAYLNSNFKERQKKMIYKL